MIRLMEEIRPTTWDIKNLLNNGINYQPQLVNAGFLNHQQYPTPTLHPTSCRIASPFVAEKIRLSSGAGDFFVKSHEKSMLRIRVFYFLCDGSK